MFKTCSLGFKHSMLFFLWILSWCGHKALLPVPVYAYVSVPMIKKVKLPTANCYITPSIPIGIVHHNLEILDTANYGITVALPREMIGCIRRHEFTNDMERLFTANLLKIGQRIDAVLIGGKESSGHFRMSCKRVGVPNATEAHIIASNRSTASATDINKMKWQQTAPISFARNHSDFMLSLKSRLGSIFYGCKIVKVLTHGVYIQTKTEQKDAAGLFGYVSNADLLGACDMSNTDNYQSSLDQNIVEGREIDLELVSLGEFDGVFRFLIPSYLINGPTFSSRHIEDATNTKIHFAPSLSVLTDDESELTIRGTTEDVVNAVSLVLRSEKSVDTESAPATTAEGLKNNNSQELSSATTIAQSNIRVIIPLSMVSTISERLFDTLSHSRDNNISESLLFSGYNTHKREFTYADNDYGSAVGNSVLEPDAFSSAMMQVRFVHLLDLLRLLTEGSIPTRLGGDGTGIVSKTWSAKQVQPPTAACGAHSVAIPRFSARSIALSHELSRRGNALFENGQKFYGQRALRYGEDVLEVKLQFGIKGVIRLDPLDLDSAEFRDVLRNQSHNKFVVDVAFDSIDELSGSYMFKLLSAPIPAIETSLVAAARTADGLSSSSEASAQAVTAAATQDRKLRTVVTTGACMMPTTVGGLSREMLKRRRLATNIERFLQQASRMAQQQSLSCSSALSPSPSSSLHEDLIHSTGIFSEHGTSIENTMDIALKKRDASEGVFSIMEHYPKEENLFFGLIWGSAAPFSLGKVYHGYFINDLSTLDSGNEVPMLVALDNTVNFTAGTNKPRTGFAGVNENVDSFNPGVERLPGHVRRGFQYMGVFRKPSFRLSPSAACSKAKVFHMSTVIDRNESTSFSAIDKGTAAHKIVAVRFVGRDQRGVLLFAPPFEQNVTTTVLVPVQ